MMTKKNNNPLRPLPRYFVPAVTLTVLAITALVTFRFNQLAASDPKAQIEALRLGLTAGVGLGGVVALGLAVRRQRATEVIAEQNSHDANEKRITELYAKAVEQLGNENAAVRLAALYSLERLGTSETEHRQTVVNVLCAYLRMPGPSSPHGEDGPASAQSTVEQEREVRLTAQRIISAHIMRADDGGRSNPHYWPGLDIDLTGAVLDNFTANRASVRTLLASNVRLLGETGLRELNVRQTMTMELAKSAGNIDIALAEFSGAVTLKGLEVESGGLLMSGAQISGYFDCGSIHVSGPLIAADCRFRSGANFADAEIGTSADFSKCRFDSWADFTDVTARAFTTFYGTTFEVFPKLAFTYYGDRDPHFEGATILRPRDGGGPSVPRGWCLEPVGSVGTLRFQLADRG